MITGRDILQSSKVKLFFELSYKNYRLLRGRLDDMQINSISYAKTKKVFNAITLIFQYSLLGRITEINEDDSTNARLENSGLVKILSRLWVDWTKRIGEYLETSLIIRNAAGLRNGLYARLVKIVNIIVVSAIISNIFFYALFKNAMHREIGVSYWFIKVLLLYVGLFGLFCEIDLKSLIETSFFVKRTRRNKQFEAEEK